MQILSDFASPFTSVEYCQYMVREAFKIKKWAGDGHQQIKIVIRFSWDKFVINRCTKHGEIYNYITHIVRFYTSISHTTFFSKNF